MAKTQKTSEQPVQTEDQATQPTASLTIQDLLVVAQIIQIGSQRGTFRAEELADVGNLYTKLIAFLQSTGALVPAQQPAAEE